jgi:3-oxoacyl-[acyl-carrier protein] reductase
MIQANLCNKTAIVTGGGSGIGLACVTILAKSGAKVAVNHLPGDCVALQAIKELKTAGYDVVGAPGDVSDSASAKSMIQEAIQQLGGSLDFLINNAGTPGLTAKPIDSSDLNSISDEFWHSVLNTNLIGPFTCAKAAAAALKQSGGCIVNMASIAGVNAQGSSIPYAASKSGVVSLTKSLARGLAPEVRVNAVAPGPTVTAWIEGLNLSDSHKQKAADISYLKRLSTPEDIAQTVLFLCAGAAMITGQTIIVDGGITL